MTFSLYPYASPSVCSHSPPFFLLLCVADSGEDLTLVNEEVQLFAMGAELISAPPLQVQNQLNAFMVLAALLWCVLAAATMILQEHSTQSTVVALW